MTSSLLVRSFAKVNLGLAVLGLRGDGYHEIRTVFQSIDLHDILELTPSSGLTLECHGLPDVAPEQNLVWRAASALMRECPGVRGARIVLRKRIPAGSGLGGGSSNAAATLLGLRRLWDVEIAPERLDALAGSLGSDVPFFLRGGTALGLGRGEELYPLPEFPAARLLVVVPGVRISTGEAYRLLADRLTADESRRKIQSLCSRLCDGLAPWPGVFNDFERVVPALHRPVADARQFLIERGAVATLLSGSGSSVFGFFREEESALAASSAAGREDWRVFPAKTLSRSGFFRQLFGPSP